MGSSLRTGAGNGGKRGVAGAGWLTLLLCAVLFLVQSANAQEVPGRDAAVRVDEGRFTVVAYPRDERLARTIASEAVRRDSFPGLPKPAARVLIAIAPDSRRFREWIGSNAPEWGAAVAFPDAQRIVMQGSSAPGSAGDPLVVLRHELAHLALHEFMGRLPPRWFDEGYASVAAGEWTREQGFETSVSLVWRALPSIDELDAGFYGGASRAQWSYALAHRVVAELHALGGDRGLANYFRYWKETGSMEIAMRQAYGMTGDAFDRHWKQQTRKRYGALSLVTSISAFVGVLALLLGPLVIARRRRDRRRLEAMRAADEAQERAAQESMLAELLEQPPS